MKSKFIRNEWVGDESCITIMNKSRKKKDVFVVLMNDYGDFDFYVTEEFDYELERDDGCVHVIFAAPVKPKHNSFELESSFFNEFHNYILLDDFDRSYGWCHAPASVVKDAILKRKNMFKYPQIDRFDLVEELYEQ